MERTEPTSRLRRFVQSIADVAAVARARYGAQLDRERERLGVAPPPREAPGSSRLAPAGGYHEAAMAAAEEPVTQKSASQPVSARGSAGHEKSREEIGDAQARPAPRQPNSPPEPCRDQLLPSGPWPTAKELFRRFGKDRCGAYAAALTFFSILSIVPALVVALAALAFLFQDPGEAMHRLQGLIAGILPGDFAGKAARASMKEANVQKSVEDLIKTRGIAGVIGLLSLVWATLQIFVNAAPAMNTAFEVVEKRGWIKLRLVAWGCSWGRRAIPAFFCPAPGPTSSATFTGSVYRNRCRGTSRACSGWSPWG